MANLKDLIVSGPARFLNKIYGDLEGNATSADKWKTERIFRISNQAGSGSSRIDGSMDSYTLTIPTRISNFEKITATTFEGNATSASKLKDASILTIGSTGKSFNGENPVSWSLNEIGAYDLSNRGIKIPDGSNLNDYTTPGNYYVPNDGSALLITNSPFTKNGYRLICQNGYDGNGVNNSGYQIAFGDNNLIRFRSCNNNTWTDWNSGYLPLSGGTLTGDLEVKNLTIAGTDDGLSHLRFNGYDGNYICFQPGGCLSINANSSTLDKTNASLLIDTASVRPGKTNTIDLGRPGYEWKDVYAANLYGDLIGGTNVLGAITIKNSIVKNYPAIGFVPRIDASTVMGSSAYIYEDMGSATGYTKNELAFRVYSPTSSGATTINNYYEDFKLPSCNIGRTKTDGNATYQILTTKEAVKVDQGGTGATSASGARTNLEVPSKTGDGASGTWGINVTGSSKKLSYPAQLTVDDAINAFNTANTFQVATWSGTSSPGVSNGIIINTGWTSTSYGAQIAIDDDPTYYIALRQRDTSGWKAWKRIPMGDGTGASGTWGISISGNAATATKLATAKTISLKGAVTGSGTFDGNDNLTITTTKNHGHTIDEINKGTILNIAGGVSAVNAAKFDVTRANRLAFLPANAITIEYTQDNGETWIDYEATDEQKRTLFAMTRGWWANLGKTGTTAIGFGLRITIEPTDRYTSVDNFYCWFSTGGHTVKLKIEYSTIGNKTTFTTLREDLNINGWSGANDITFSAGTFGGGSDQTSNRYAYRFTFMTTAINSNFTNQLPSVSDIRLYGDNAWGTPNSMMLRDHIYNWDISQNVSFPANISGNSANNSWIYASKKGAFRLETAASGQMVKAVLSMKTNSGSWSIANKGGDDKLYFVFGTDENYNAGTNTTNNYTISTDGAWSGSAAKLTNAQTLKIGSTSKSFDGSAPISWNLNEIGAYDLANRGTVISSGSNLNDYTTVGNYCVPDGATAAKITNTPFTKNGYRLICQSGYAYATGVGGYGYQIAFGSTNLIKFRVCRDGTWLNWESYLPLSGGTLTGNLTVPTLTISSKSSAQHIKFSRDKENGGYNYITVPSDGTLVINCKDSAASATSSLLITSTELRPGTTDTINLGTNDYKWKNVYATNLYGTLTSKTFDNVTVAGNLIELPVLGWDILGVEAGDYPAYFEALLRWIVDSGNYSGEMLTFIGTAYPGKRFSITGTVYDMADVINDTGLPKYCCFSACGSSGVTYYFGTNEGEFYLNKLTADYIGAYSLKERGTKIEPNTDLNEIKVAGNYYIKGGVDAKTIKNAPFTDRGCKLIFQDGYDGNINNAYQIAFGSADHIKTRNYFNGAWRDWFEYSKANHTHNYAGSSSAGGAANTVNVTLKTNETSYGSYSIPFHQGSSSGAKSLLTNDGIAYLTLEGDETNYGYGTIRVGNSTALGTAGNKQGRIRMYGKGSGFTTIVPGNNTSNNITLTLPSTDGTIALITSNVESANKLYTTRTIDGVSFNGTANITHYGTCSTAAATAAKVVALTGFELTIGAKVAVKFTYTNTASNPTLSVNDTTAKPIYYRGSPIAAGYLAAKRVYEFVYDGTNYELIGDINTNTTYNDMTGATSSTAGTRGLVPAPAAGRQNYFLRGDGTWAVPTNTSAVSSVNNQTGAVTLTYSDVGAAASSHTHSDYLPLAGGTMTGAIITPGDDSAVIRPSKNNYDTIGSPSFYFYEMYSSNYYLGTGTADMSTGTLKIKTIKAPVSSGSASYGVGSDGQVLKSNGSTVYWGTVSGGTSYTLPQATNNTLGGVKIGYSENGKNYPVELNTNGQMYVNVPWTDNNTHYTTKIYAGTSGTTANATATNPYLTVTDSSTYRNQVRFVGSGGISINSDTSGNITINSVRITSGTGEPTGSGNTGDIYFKY